MKVRGSRDEGHAQARLLAAMLGMLSLLVPMLFVVCVPMSPPSTEPARGLIAKGERIFFGKTFNGNGRTCGTCHRAEDNFGLSPAFIATLPDDDPLFVAEFNPDLRENFEKPKLMREFGLILENLDGFDDLENQFVLRGVPHVLALRTSVDSAQGPRTGWSGDGSPGDGSLRSFAVGAVIQHFPKTLNRVPGVDFRLPSERELDALEAFMLSLGRAQDPSLPLPLKGTVTQRGQEIFLDDSLGKCNICHVNAGATANLGGQNVGNANFNTGVENLPDQPPDLTGERVPPDDGFGTPGDGTFNTPPLVESADTGPFFHNNAIETIEGAVAFYNGDAFNRSPAGLVLAGFDPNGVGIKLDALEAFMLSLGRAEDLTLPLPLKGTVTRRGQEIFLDPSLGKCNICHVNAGATANLGGQNVGNANFNTGVEALPDQPPDLAGERVPPDDGFGTPGDGTFNTPPLVESADTSPFFHNNAIGTIEGAVAFYNGDAFNRSPAGLILAGLDPNGVGIKLDATQVEAVAAFLRAINALENIRVSTVLLEAGRLQRAIEETEDAIRVLEGGGLHPEAVARLERAAQLAKEAHRSFFGAGKLIQAAIRAQREARAQIVEAEASTPDDGDR